MYPHDSGRFPTTAWTVVRKAQDFHSPERLAALNRCIITYWRPVFFYVRARGHSFHRAEDLTQEFFLRFLEKNWIRPADPERGRFRTFLLAVLKRFLSDQGPERAPRQKVFDDQLVSISALMSDQERSFEPPSHETPDEIFKKHWALAVIASVRRQVELWCEHRGRPDWYLIFAAVNFPSPGSAPATQQALAERFRLSRDQIRYALDQVGKQFVEALHDQVEGGEELDAEINGLDPC